MLIHGSNNLFSKSPLPLKNKVTEGEEKKRKRKQTIQPPTHMHKNYSHT